MNSKIAVLGALLAGSLPSQGTLAIKAGRLIPISGQELQNATVLIENGKIKAVGTDIEVPWDAKIIDASDMVVMPTYVTAHTTAGFRTGNENLANIPYITVADGIDPANAYFEESLRNGVGTIHVIQGNQTLFGGQGMILKPYGKTIEEMAVRSRSGLKLSLAPAAGSRMAQIQKMRRGLEDIVEYIADHERKRQEFEREKAAGATSDESFDEEMDPLKKPMVDVLQGNEKAYFYIPSAVELAEARRLIAKYDLDVVLVLGPRCHQAVESLAQSGIPVILDATMEYETTDSETEVVSSHCPAALFTKAGKEYALSLSTSANTMNRYPWWQMATAMRNGVTREQALASLTIVPARILGLEDDVGTLEPGKAANLQILTGDPLKATSWVETVILDGEVVYERDRDGRLRHLFGKDRADRQSVKN
ncbi:MAG: hypothetical protein CMJ89_20910 [Planctomycetes bacterium]|nr:hypothetical protein [Planctomycetota bacterium]